MSKLFRTPPVPKLTPIRATRARTAVVLVHGWTAIAESAFGVLPEVLVADDVFGGWDVFRLQYRSELRLNVPFVWAEPNLSLLGRYLVTTLTIEPLSAYESLLLVGHSMGGVVVQAALLDANARKRVGYVALVGTPSAGINVPTIRKIVQLRDLAAGSRFVKSLRDQWNATFAKILPFRLAAIAGNNDVVVSPESSIEPFPENCRSVISGDHATIASVDGPTHELVGVLRRMLRNEALASTEVDTAMLALEERRYRRVIELLGPSASKLDKNALVTLALAYDAVGEPEAAIDVLTARSDLDLDALGTLAGRYKRRWLAGHQDDDLSRSRDLYRQGYSQARLQDEPGQLMYHAINLSFLAVMTTPESSTEPATVRELITEAKSASERATPSYWTAVTNAEALLISGDYDAALTAYASAREKHSTDLRERQSTYLNARHLVLKRRRPDLDVKLATALFGDVARDTFKTGGPERAPSP